MGLLLNICSLAFLLSFLGFAASDVCFKGRNNRLECPCGCCGSMLSPLCCDGTPKQLLPLFRPFYFPYCDDLRGADQGNGHGSRGNDVTGDRHDDGDKEGTSTTLMIILCVALSLAGVSIILILSFCIYKKCRASPKTHPHESVHTPTIITTKLSGEPAVMTSVPPPYVGHPPAYTADPSQRVLRGDSRPSSAQLYNVLEYKENAREATDLNQ